MLDWEAPGVTNVSSNVLNQSTMSQWVNEWCYYVSNYAKTKGITMKVMVYSARGIAHLVPATVAD